MFKDIKVGEFVLVPVSVDKGFMDKSPKTFWCRCKVSKVTPKRFEANKSTYKKVDGSSIESRGMWERPLHGCLPYTEETDQFEEYKAYKEEVSFRNSLCKTLHSVSAWDMTLDQLKRIDEILKEGK